VNTTLQTVAPSLQNMTPNVFTASAGSVFVPDNSSFENNDPTNVGTVALNGTGLMGLPVAAVGGHNWEFDQGSTTCKETSTSSGTPPIAIIPGQAPAGWAIPPNTTTDCFVLPVVKFQTVTVKTDLIKGQVTTSTSVGSSCNGIPGSTRTFFSNGNGFVTGIGIAPDMNFTTAGSVTTAGAPTPAAGATGSGSVIVDGPRPCWPGSHEPASALGGFLILDGWHREGARVA
jgi:hypothetical protein